MKYGYVRVSTKEQNIDRQMSAMKTQGLSQGDIFIDKASGKNFNRKEYKRMLRRLKQGDEVFIKSIDRLGRNYDEIIWQWKLLTKEKEVNLIVIDFPLLDTRKKINGLTGTFIADLVLQIMSYVAQIERENTHKRQMEGIREAQKRGVKFGRKSLAKPDNYGEVAEFWRSGQISLREGIWENYERTQEVEIYLNFIGKFEMPKKEPTKEEVEEMEKLRKKKEKKREYNYRYMKKIKEKCNK